jgi:hypothetical protein
MLAVAVEEILKQPLTPVSPGLRTAFELIDLPYPAPIPGQWSEI